MMGVMAVLARNNCIDSTGYSPQQRMTGAGHRLPFTLNGAGEDVDPEFLWQGPRDDVRRREELRQAAWRSLVETQSRERLLRATRAQHRIPLRDLHPGELIMVWRQPGHQKGSWHGPGSVVMIQGQHVWCAMRGNVWKINRTHVRPTTSEESQGQELLQRYLQTITEEVKGSKRGPKRFMDGTREPEPPHLEEPAEEGRVSKQPRLTGPSSSANSGSVVSSSAEIPGASSVAATHGEDVQSSLEPVDRRQGVQWKDPFGPDK
eukprot:2228811-Amphidinium_carterae.2